ncbi:hypothetical protein M514_06493 [Trichuris suis]|uniref:ISXO2-like transposase domain-containing protein n=1 Tax=Trichuris suis TaxID=68888 RepID=A0A085M600_9BILA|nr:hypothetical protein M513_06493 [Trichuris suis]KFD63847.1 hypothetical protein M514_06493 [Trichuris suis]
MEHIGINRKVALQWNSKTRTLALASLQSVPVAIGGLGQTVEINETLFSRRKYNRGRATSRSSSGYSVAFAEKRANASSFPMQDRSSDTLIPLIKEHVRAGSTIISDECCAYRRLPQEGYPHLRVNHSVSFVNKSNREIHTQDVESMWSQLKRRNKERSGTRRNMLDSYLAEFMWRRRLGNNDEAFHSILREIATMFPPC